MKKLLIVSVLSSILIGCGGGGGGSDSSSNNTTTPQGDVTTPNTQDKINGIYTNADGVILIDTNSKNSLLVFSENGSEIIESNTALKTTNNGVTYTATGITAYGNNAGNDILAKITASLNNNSLHVTVTDAPESMTATKTSNSIPLNELSGTYVDVDGSLLTIKPSGEFLSYDNPNLPSCTLTGTLKLTNSTHYTLTANAAGCSNLMDDGQYTGIVLTANNKMYSLIKHDFDAFGGVTPLKAKQ
ncbi:hypothetical protein ACPV36_19495 [Photobacterium damselae]|uniref:hypothetical protein n=1 Tax=Photobacterium damselae TaxID=38293 RepID=UPI004067D062